MASETAFHRAIAWIDEANAGDPSTEQTADGFEPKQLVYSRRMTRALARLVPDASQVLQIAVRGQHIERWNMPRAAAPAGRSGYLHWRSALKDFHAERVAAIMREAGFDEADVDRAARIVRKQGLGHDRETQALEDAACHVFLEYELGSFAASQPDEVVQGILAKMLAKMSSKARVSALDLPIPSPWNGFLALLAGTTTNEAFTP